MSATRFILIDGIKQRPDESDVTELVLMQTGLRREQLRQLRVVRQSVDARDKRDVFFSLHVLVGTDELGAKRLLSGRGYKAAEYTPPAETPLVHGTKPLRGRIAVVGLGPAGLFSAWLLAREGYRPLVIERGKPVESRAQDVEGYWSGAALNPESNVSFGEGGAGTFSDGKLTTRIKDPRADQVIRLLHSFGAPREILTLAKPHIGTDLLRKVVSAMRREIENLGGEVRFDTKLSGLDIRDGALNGAFFSSHGEVYREDCSALVLAIGHSARDSYRMLHESGVLIVPKPFAVGVRAEHPQAFIDRSQYGDFAGHPRLGAAEYRLSAKSGSRGVYTFCMCPGGEVIAAASGENQAVVNGMSLHARNGANANAAIVVQVGPEDYGFGPLDGLLFCERIEKAAYDLGAGAYPAARVADYMSRRATRSFGAVKPSCRRGVRGVELSRCLPDFVYEGIRQGIMGFSRQLRGYDMGDAVLTAIESRTSSPLRIQRDELGQSASCEGLYPVGEGAGYAGGIVSAAADGLKSAERIISQFSPNC